MTTVIDEAESSSKMQEVITVLRQHGEELKALTKAYAVRPGYSRDEDAKPLIVALEYEQKVPADIPADFYGIPVEVRPASALDILEGILPLSAWDPLAPLPEAKPAIHYKPPPEELVKLKEVTVKNVTCHVGPDSGWSTLSSYLLKTEQSLTIAMYEFYADHIVSLVKKLGEDTEATLDIVLQVDSKDKNMEEDLRQSWGERLNFARASVAGPGKLFNNSYHTKVAVRDSKDVWISSGNWSPNSQPVIEEGTEKILFKQGNREWHVIIEDKRIAELYEKFIRYDIAQAQAVASPESTAILPDVLIPEVLMPEAAVIQPHPFNATKIISGHAEVRVMPLMSPDNYAASVVDLINGAEESIYLQFSYIKQPSSDIFDQIMTAIARKMKDGLDVRVIVGTNQKAEHSDAIISKYKWKRSMFRRQTTKLHNKGIVIDGKIAGVGSNNWSNDGTQYNRDTTIIFYSEEIAKYYTEVFLFDWENLTRPITSAPAFEALIAPPSGPTPLGLVRLPWQAWFDE